MLQNKMQIKGISIIIGITLALVVVFHLHNFIIVDACLDAGGKYDFDQNICIRGDTYEEYYIVLSWVVFAIYIIVGAIFATLFAFITKKILKLQ